MTTHLDAACDAAAYKPGASATWIDAVSLAFSVLHDIQWRAPWDDAQQDRRPAPRTRPE